MILDEDRTIPHTFATLARCVDSMANNLAVYFPEWDMTGRVVDIEPALDSGGGVACHFYVTFFGYRMLKFLSIPSPSVGV